MTKGTSGVLVSDDGKTIKLCDLHTHSIFSDGTCSPSEVLCLAKEAGLKAVALTDHNTIDGVEIFLKESKNYGIEGVAGVEFSSEYEGKSIHVIALLFEEKFYSKIRSFLQIPQERKRESNDLLAKRLVEKGYAINYEKIKSNAVGQINRVQFAKELIALGVVNTVEEACNTILSENGDIYVPPKRLTTFEVIDFIKSIDAISVLAHPLLDLSKQELLEFLPKAKAHGLDAMETKYSRYIKEEQEFSEQIAKDFGLLTSGGSDFHGQNKPDIAIGQGRGNLQVPYEFLAKLKKLKANKKKVDNID